MPIVVVTTTGGGSATVRSEDSTFLEEGVRANQPSVRCFCGGSEKVKRKRRGRGKGWAKQKIINNGGGGAGRFVSRLNW